MSSTTLQSLKWIEEVDKNSPATVHLSRAVTLVSVCFSGWNLGNSKYDSVGTEPDGN